MLKNDLLSRYRKGDCTDLEKQIVEEWYGQYQEEVSLSEVELDKGLQRLDGRIKKIPFIRRISTIRVMGKAIAAAAIVLIFCFIGYQQFEKKRSGQLGDTVIAEVLPPSGSRTTVTLKNNEKIALDDIKIGDTVDADGYLIARLASGDIQYIALAGHTKPIFNTIETGVGRATSIILADGTKMWLNANSKVIYPTVFAPDIREVYLEGEAYFEVVHSNKLANNPAFYVKTTEHTLRVYGTKFNINTYQNNYVATLLEGKIGLKKEAIALGERKTWSGDVILEPQQQYSENSNVKISRLNQPELLLDWKDGYFNLTDLDLKEITDKLSLWYGVDFQIDKDVIGQKFFGQVSKQKKLSEVLTVLSEGGDLDFRMDKEKVYVKKKNK